MPAKTAANLLLRRCASEQKIADYKIACRYLLSSGNAFWSHQRLRFKLLAAAEEVLQSAWGHGEGLCRKCISNGCYSRVTVTGRAAEIGEFVENIAEGLAKLKHILESAKYNLNP